MAGRADLDELEGLTIHRLHFDDLCLVELEPPRRFLERSRTLAFSVWEHERLVEPDEDGCRVTDRLGFELRPGLRSLPGAASIARGIVGRLFSHRHRRLRGLGRPAWSGV